MRADARRNRDRLLQAADHVFSAQGPTAATEDIARAAGVGIGTLFRHFPTKEALLAAVFTARLRQLADQADQLGSADDPAAAFATFFRHVIAEARTRLTLVDALAGAGIDLSAGAGIGEAKRDLNAALQQLLRRAQQAGRVRPDVGFEEVLALIVGTARAVQAGDCDPASESRIVGVVLDGLAVHPPQMRA